MRISPDSQWVMMDWFAMDLGTENLFMHEPVPSGLACEGRSSRG